MFSLSEYTIRISRHPIFYTWTYRITTPDGRTIFPFGMYLERSHAEIAALKQVEIDHEQETLTGEELRNKVRGTSE